MHCAFFLATFFNKFVYKNCSFSSPYCLFGWEKDAAIPDIEVIGMGIELSQLQFFNCQIKT